MANDTSTGYSSNWNVPNMPGAELITFSSRDFPFLSRLGRPKVAQSDEYAMSAQYALETFAQPAITEADSITAPAAVAYDRTNELNVIQIFQKAVNPTYVKLASTNRLKYAESATSGYAYSSDPRENAIQDELATEIAMVQQQLYGDLEVSTLSGTYAKSTSASVANKMRGIVSAVTTNTVAASSAQLEKAHFNEVLRTMAGSGSKFMRPVIFANAYQKQKLSDIYSFVPMDRNVGGGNIQMIETDFGMFEVVYCRQIAAGTILLADMAVCSLVIQPVPGKSYMPDGLFLYENLAKTGASEKSQLFGLIGLDYGSQLYHGTITGLATS